MSNKILLTRFSCLISGAVFFLTALAVYAKAVPLMVSGLFVLTAVGINYYFLIRKNYIKYPSHILASLFLVFSTLFSCMTGGFFSPGILIIFFMPVLTSLFSEKKFVVLYNGIVLAFLFFLYMSPPMGPGVLNINQYRFFFLVVVFILHAWGMAVVIGQNQKDCNALIKSNVRLKEVSQDAEAAMEIKDRFLANMSHEIRNPMNGIIGMMHVLLDSDLNEEQKEYSKIVYNSTRALLSIVNDILDLSKIKAGKLELDIISFDLEIAIKDIVSLPELTARQKGLDFTYSLDSNVPRLLKGDIGRIRQIILNLTGNAIKFTESGSICLDISMEPSHNSDDEVNTAWIHFSVDDTGIGIKDEKINSLFSSFTQADASITKKFGGTGLGLSIAKRLVEKMEGKIGAQSIEMVGSTFWFDLPLEKQSREEISFNPAGVHVTDYKILIISDKTILGKNFTGHVSDLSIQYEQAFDDVEALEMLKWAMDDDFPFHLIIMEVQESDQYARRLGKMINKDPGVKHLKMILLTAVGQKGDARSFEELGFSAFLSEPVEKDVLSDCIKAVMSIQGKNKEVCPIITRFSLEETRKQSWKILIVEDMETNLITAKALIGRHGYHTWEARNGQEAVLRYKEEPCDLILMDCQMPVMDGLEATRQIRLHEKEHGLPQVPIIAMTGNAFESDREKCFKAGMDDFISKPVEPDILARKIKVHLEEKMFSKALSGNEPKINKPDIIEPDIIKPEFFEPDTFGGKKVQDSDSLLETKEVVCFNRPKLFERFGNDEELIRAVLDAFFQEAPGLIENLQTAIGSQDIESIQSHAHALKGSAGNVNADALQELSLGMEQAVKEGDLASTSLIIADIEKGYNAFFREAII